MKIYFVASIKGKERFAKNYEVIIRELQKMGHKVIEDTLKSSLEDVYGLSDREKIKFYQQVLHWINYCDLVIAETSFPSLGIGFEISQALEKGKPVVVLYTEEDIPHFIQGVESEKLLVVKYSLVDVREVLREAIEDARGQADVRFNFFIPPQIVAFLDWVAKNRKLPRAVYLRKLIEEDMKKNKAYKSS